MAAKKPEAKKETPKAAPKKKMVKPASKTPSSSKKVPKKELVRAEDTGEKITVRRKSTPKKVNDQGEKITVTVNKTPSILESKGDAVKTPAKFGLLLTDEEEIPEDILPSADELDLHDKKVSKKEAAAEELWAEELINEDSTMRLDEQPSDKLEERAFTVARPPEVIQPKKKREVVPEPEDDDGQLLGYIKQHAKPNYDDVDPALVEHHRAHNSLSKPSVFDTQIVHPPLKAGSKKKHSSAGGTWIIVFCMLMIAVAVYLAIDYGLLGDNIKVPYSFFK